MFQKILNFFKKDQMKKINDDLYVGPQINSNDISNLVEMGIKSIVCNRPDNEGEGQTNFEIIQNVTQENNLKVHYIPFSAGKMTSDDVVQFSKVLKDGPFPIFAYCLGGVRSAQIASSAYQLIEEENK